MRTNASSLELAKYSCVTSDGIELAYRYSGKNGVISSGEASRIERRAVLAADVRPPVEALDLRAWNELIDQAGEAPGGSPSDFEAVIDPENEATIPAARVTRIVRRHYPWTSTDERRTDGGRTLRIRNETSQFSLLVEVDAKSGLRLLAVNKFPLNTTAVGGPVDLNRSEIVLSET